MDIGDIGLKFPAILLALAVFCPRALLNYGRLYGHSQVSYLGVPQFQASPAKVSREPVVVIGWMEGCNCSSMLPKSRSFIEDWGPKGLGNLISTTEKPP